METTPQKTTPKEAPRANCTAVVDRLHASNLVVCRAGSVVALHLYTNRGEVICTIEERHFVKAARGVADHNGNPWRAQESPTANRDVLEADAAQVAISQNLGRPRKGRDPEELNRFIEVQQLREAGSPLNFRQLCEKVGCNYARFFVWRSDNCLTVGRLNPVERRA